MGFIKEKIRQHLNNFLGSSVFLKQDRKVLLRNIDYMVNNSQKKDKVIYTCFTGNYDDLILQNYIDNSFDYVCFTDSKELLSYNQYGVWKIKALKFSELDNTKNARWHKTHPHILFPDYSESIWIDGNININGSYVFDQISQKNTDLLIPFHWKDDCIYNEIENVLEVIVPEGGETKENVDKISNFLIQHNFPKHYGLNETNFVYRCHNNPEIIRIMEEWWEFIRDYTKRDQLSLSYVLWKHSIKPSDIAIDNLRKRPDAVEFVQHKSRKQQ
ncbi:MAG: DUF616 domain-containing protein [Treponema sp.]|nr:DUF616 domain-containing protein [Treponema sp.]